jgi:hypothetical protein
MNMSKYIAVVFVLTTIAASARPHDAEFQAGASPDKTYTQNAVTIWSEYPQSTSKSEGNLYVGNNKAGKMFRALLDFDLSSIPADATIESVELILYQCTDSTSPAGELTAGLYQYNDSVYEGSTCWRDADGLLGGLLQTTEVDPSDDGERCFFSTSELVKAVQDALRADGKFNVAIKLEDENYEGRRLVMFRGNEYKATVNRPQLTVTYE